MRERLAKVVLSVLAIALFGAVGVVVAGVNPFRWPAEPARPADSELRGRPAGAPDAPQLPVPPDTELTFNTRARAGQHYRYESRLSAEGLWRFYDEQMPPLGWARDRAFEAVWRRQRGLQPVLSFKRHGTRCIIGLEEGDMFSTIVTVLVVGTAR